MSSLRSKFELSVLAILGAFWLSTQLSATHQGTNRPSANDFHAWLLGQRGPMAITSGGAVLLPNAAYSGLANGRVSPIMQFVLANHMMTSAVADAIRHRPHRRTAYVVAKQMFEQGICRVKKAFQQAMLMSFLSGMSQNTRVGGSTDPQDRESSRQQSLAFLTSFQKDGDCDGGGGGEGFDPMLLMLLQQGNSHTRR